MTEVSSGAQPRRAAAELLICVLKQRKTLDEALNSVDTYDALEGPDRGFGRAMASTALRELGLLDEAIDEMSDRPRSYLNFPILALLRLGLAQLWKMGVEPHAAVNATVQAANEWPEARAGAGFLNAILRRATREPKNLDEPFPLGIWPDWFRKQLVSDVGEEAAIAIANAQRREPELHLTVKNNVDEWAKRLGGVAIGDVTVSVPQSDVSALDGYDSGDWWVQDVAATLAARLLPISDGDTVVDLCAAPGGKTLQLASQGARVIAIDRSKRRLERLSENCARTGFSENVDRVTANVEGWRPETLMPGILLDAPCSAFGTLRRHPEGPWIKREEDISRFPDVQLRLLRAAHAMLKADGILIYCVCTPLSAEGRAVIDTVVSEGLFVRDPIKDHESLGFETALTFDGDLLSIPNRAFDHDVFFISRLKKNTQ